MGTYVTFRTIAGVGTIDLDEAKEILFEAVRYHEFTGEGDEEVRNAREILSEFIDWDQVDALYRTVRWSVLH